MFMIFLAQAQPAANLVRDKVISMLLTELRIGIGFNLKRLQENTVGQVCNFFSHGLILLVLSESSFLCPNSVTPGSITDYDCFVCVCLTFDRRHRQFSRTNALKELTNLEGGTFGAFSTSPELELHACICIEFMAFSQKVYNWTLF